MKYIHSTDAVMTAAEHIATILIDKLTSGKRVTWIISGGSGIDVCIIVASRLDNIDASNLTVTLSDERYGEVGHQNENWQQLLNAGFSIPNATLYRPLLNQDKANTISQFDTWLSHHITSADYSIGLFGIGSDGHTAGIKPHSSAATATTWADGFIGDDFDRITMTAHAITQLDEAVIQASGPDKTPILKSLLNDSLDIDEQPAQILKQVPIATLYSDSEILQ